jgi:hypothetical protein
VQRKKALASCRSPQLKRNADLANQWWTPLSCHMGRHVTRVFVPDVTRTSNSQRYILMQSLNRSANYAATGARKFGDTVVSVVLARLTLSVSPFYVF